MSVRTISCPGVRDQQLHDAQWDPELGLLTCPHCCGIFTAPAVADALLEQIEAFDSEWPALAEVPVSADEERLRGLADELLGQRVRPKLVDWLLHAAALRLAVPSEYARRAVDRAAAARLGEAA